MTLEPGEPVDCPWCGRDGVTVEHAIECGKVIALARECRASENPLKVAQPVALYAMAGNNGALYNHAMREAGYIVDARTQLPEDPCRTCGWSPEADDDDD